MLLKIRCWIVQMLMPKELRIYFQLFLIEKLKEMEQELEDIACGKTDSYSMEADTESEEE